MSFEKSLSIFDDLEAEINKEARDSASFVLKSVIDETPIDTGQAKGSWQAAVGSPTRRQRSKLRRQGSARREGEKVIKSAKEIKFPTLFITSNLIYMPRLNDGHSKQAPSKYIDMIAQRVRNAILTIGGTNG